MKKRRSLSKKSTAAVLSAVGGSLIKAGAVAGRTLGRGAAKLYRSIDPDLKRHLVQAPILSYSLFFFREAAIDPQKSDGYPPLIFVHGLGGSRGDFLPMSAYFWLQGRSRSYRIYFRRGQSIPQMAASLARFIRRVKKITGEKRVEIIAHSLGGVISRIVVTDHDLAGSVRALVTLGSPHQGTHSARLLNTENLRDLRPDSSLMRRLRRKKWPKDVRGLAFWSRSDLMVLPAESGTFPGMSAIDMTPFTHYNYLIDPKCWQAVYRSLETSC